MPFTAKDVLASARTPSQAGSRLRADRLARDVSLLHAALRTLEPGRVSDLPTTLPGPIALGAPDGHVEAAASLLQRPGIDTVAVEPAFMAAAERAFTALRKLDTYEDLRPMADRLGPGLRTLLARAPEIVDPVLHAELTGHGKRLRREADEFMDAYPLLLLPVSEDALAAAAWLE